MYLTISVINKPKNTAITVPRSDNSSFPFCNLVCKSTTSENIAGIMLTFDSITYLLMLCIVFLLVFFRAIPIQKNRNPTHQACWHREHRENDFPQLLLLDYL